MKKVLLVVNDDGVPIKGFVSPSRAESFKVEHERIFDVNKFHIDEVMIDEELDPKDMVGPAESVEINIGFVLKIRVSDLDPYASIGSEVEEWLKQCVALAFDPESLPANDGPPHPARGKVLEVSISQRRILDAAGRQVDGG